MTVTATPNPVMMVFAYWREVVCKSWECEPEFCSPDTLRLYPKDPALVALACSVAGGDWDSVTPLAEIKSLEALINGNAGTEVSTTFRVYSDYGREDFPVTDLTWMGATSDWFLVVDCAQGVELGTALPPRDLEEIATTLLALPEYTERVRRIPEEECDDCGRILGAVDYYFDDVYAGYWINPQTTRSWTDKQHYITLCYPCWGKAMPSLEGLGIASTD